MIYICLPIYNEEGCLEKLLNKIGRYFSEKDISYRIIAVDDGSTDNSPAVLNSLKASLPIDIITHQSNMGLGTAVRSLLDTVVKTASDEDVVITMDADDTHPLIVIEDMLYKIDAGADVVIASRYQEGSREIGLSALRKLYTLCAGALLKLFFPYPGLNDYSSGYRAYKAAVLKKAFVFYKGSPAIETGFAVMAEIIIKLSFLRANIVEVPMRLLYSNKKGKSKIRVPETVISYFKLINKLRRVKRF